MSGRSERAGGWGGRRVSVRGDALPPDNDGAEVPGGETLVNGAVTLPRKTATIRHVACSTRSIGSHMGQRRQRLKRMPARTCPQTCMPQMARRASM